LGRWNDEDPEDDGPKDEFRTFPSSKPLICRGYIVENEKGEIESIVQQDLCGCIRIFNVDATLRGWEPCPAHKAEDDLDPANPR
jgi:hypothetical protein